jgi:fructoselysine-6-P-deglycase FrlB-like protein
LPASLYPGEQPLELNIARTPVDLRAARGATSIQNGHAQSPSSESKLRAATHIDDRPDQHIAFPALNRDKVYSIGSGQSAYIAHKASLSIIGGLLGDG